MRERLALVSVSLFICLFPWFISSSATEESSCMKCHTDAQILKSLAKAPVVQGGEGEG
jgi:hypothetical protein